MGNEILSTDINLEVNTPDGSGKLVGFHTEDGKISRVIVLFEGDLYPGDLKQKVITAVAYLPDQVWMAEHA